MKIIKSSKGEDILVSKGDFEFLSRHSWFIQSNGYAYTTVDGKAIGMHSLVVGTKTGGMVADHINRNKLDNRKENLRLVSVHHNALNKGKMKGAKRKYKSPYVGVFHKHSAETVRYEAGATLKNRYFYLGRFKDEKEAAKQRDAFMYFLYKEISFLNLPECLEEYKTWEFSDSIMKRYEKWG